MSGSDSNKYVSANKALKMKHLSDLQKRKNPDGYHFDTKSKKKQVQKGVVEFR
ncbi:hypothetical protein HMPREF1987_00874 [Peptostreptococcaceae bacterium oral taxon 113 str. W5053]|nr:hypothetical protein HMPREF1987_00874 [Peptostreptococcaceae bacterium oral taxon 113 str. W5053]